MDPSGRIDLPDRRSFRGLIVGGVAIVVAAVAVAAFFSLRGPAPVTTTPDLVGLSLEAAAVSAEQAGLEIMVSPPPSVTTSQDGSPDPLLTVHEQDPAPGTVVPRHSIVRVSARLPTVPVPVPDVVGMGTSQARDTLLSAGLSVGVLHEDRVAGAQAGSVSRQRPAAGVEAAAGSTVDLWVVSVDSTVVPDLADMTQSEAQAAASAAGLTLQFLSEVTDEVLPGRVIRQSPRAGESVAPGSDIVAVVNAAVAPTPSEGGASGDLPPGSLYAALARTYTFPVLYPRALPAGLALDPAPDNPRHVLGPGGEQGFEVRYVDPSRPEIRASLLQGDWFEVGPTDQATVDVRGYPAVLTRVGAGLMVGWREGEVTYAVDAEGLTEADIVALADGLRPVSRD